MGSRSRSRPWSALPSSNSVWSREIDHERELLRALMENIPDLIYFKDRQFRFTRVNQAHALALGAGDSAECVGRTDSTISAPEDASSLALPGGGIAAVQASPRSIASNRLQQFSGDSHVGCRPPKGRDVRSRRESLRDHAGISRDVTALKNSCIMLREEKASAEFANRAKSEFSGHYES